MKTTQTVSKYVLGAFLVVAMQSCSGFNQDPFTEKIDAIKNAVPPTVDQKDQNELRTQFLTFETPDIVGFKESVKGNYTFKVKHYFGADYNLNIDVANLTDFPGLQFNKATNEITWTPFKGIVPSNKTVTSKVLVFKIEPVSISGTSTKISTHTVKVPVFIESDLAKPEIVKVEILNYMVEEGNKLEFNVIVKDNSASQSTIPSLQFLSQANMRSVASYTFIRTPSFDTVTQTWKFVVTVDLISADVTKSMEDAPLMISAVNSFGYTSMPTQVRLTVATKLVKAQSTLPSANTFVAGKENTVSFTIFDPSGESQVSLLTTVGLPAGASLTCANQAKMFAECKLTWTPDVSEIGKVYRAGMSIQTKGTAAMDTRTVTNDILFDINVITK